MAIVHADNFSIYGTNTAYLLNGVYASIGAFGTTSLKADPSGEAGTVLRQGFGVQNGGDLGIRYALKNTTTTLGIAARIWLEQLQVLPNLGIKFCTFLDNASNQILSVYFDPTGRIVVKDRLGNVYTSTTPRVTANAFYHIEVKCYQDNLTGLFEVRVEGQSVLLMSGLALGSNAIAQFTLGDYYNNLTKPGWGACFKDLVVWDNTGSYNNDFVGSVLVVSLLPNSDVSLNWTPSTGTTGYSILDNVPPNDSQYISAGFSPIPSPYVCTMTHVPDDTTSVRAIITRVRAQKSDGGDGQYQTGIQSDTLNTGTWSTTVGEARPITTAMTYWSDIFETDPATSAAWSPSGANQARLQLNRLV